MPRALAGRRVGFLALQPRTCIWPISCFRFECLIRILLGLLVLCRYIPASSRGSVAPSTSILIAPLLPRFLGTGVFVTGPGEYSISSD